MAATKLDLKMVMTNMMMGFYRSPNNFVLRNFPFYYRQKKRALLMLRHCMMS